LNKDVLRKKGETTSQNGDVFSIRWESNQEDNFPYILEKVKIIINENLNKDEKIRQKYEWLKSYLEESRGETE